MGSSDSGFFAWDNFWQGYRVKKKGTWSKSRIIRTLSDYIKPGMDILDAGCGSGFFSSYFISQGCNVYSLDYSEEALAITRKATNYRSSMYINSSILDKGICSSLNLKFDAIFTDGLLEHYSSEEQDGIISNMKAIKKENGYIINFVPNRFSLWSMVRPFVIDIKERPFTMREFIGLHMRNGLDIISYGGISVVPFRISPERLLGRHFGMLFYCVAV